MPFPCFFHATALLCARHAYRHYSLFSILSYLNERLLSFWVSRSKRAKLPFFKYDTPYSAANSFRQLLAEHAPLVLVFMSNFDHPITRTFVVGMPPPMTS